MASKTVNYQLTKPDETDFYDIAVQNENMDRIDSAIRSAGEGQTAGNVLSKLLTVDGIGSGLDADLLDGKHASEFVLSVAYTPEDILTKLKTVDGSESGVDADLLDGKHANEFQSTIVKGTIAIPSSGWTNTSGNYSYKLNLPLSGVASSDNVIFEVDKESESICSDAGMSHKTIQYNGGVTLFAKRIPSSAISTNYLIIR